MMRTTLSLWLCGALAALGMNPTTTTKARPQAAANVVDVETVGPKVGEPVPDFSLPDQHGTARTLKSIMGPKGAILVFFRSADW